MFGIVRMGDFCTGHFCFPPRIPITFSLTVFATGLPVVRMGDIAMPHCCPDLGCHPGVYLGCGRIFAEGRPVQKMADFIACGSFCLLGSFNSYSGF